MDLRTMKNRSIIYVFAAILLVVAWGCTTPTSGAEQRAAKARFEYNRIMREWVVPAGDATNTVERMDLLVQAAQEYQQFERDFRDQPRWAAAALRSLGQVQLNRAIPTNTGRLFSPGRRPRTCCGRVNIAGKPASTISR
jgi:hypothetical protein